MVRSQSPLCLCLVPGVRLLLRVRLLGSFCWLDRPLTYSSLFLPRRWNPAVEEQACDRIHRLGQTRPVSVARFVAAGTIEERMTELQALKRQIMQISMDPSRSKASLQKLRLEMVSRLIQ